MDLLDVFFIVVGGIGSLYLIWFLHVKDWLFKAIIGFGIAASFGPMSGWDAFLMTLSMIACYAFLASNFDDNGTKDWTNIK